MAAPVFLTAEWRSLVMLSYEADPALLEARVPAGTTLDTLNGRTLVSVVGFRFERARLRGLPIPWHSRFEEVNLRFYVRRDLPDGPRRGVVFIREIVPLRAVAWTARVFYNEPYMALPMRSRVDLEAGRLAYEWRLDRRWNQLGAEVRGEPEVPADDSAETFITEHYWGYTRQRDGSTLEYEVEHPRWRVWRAESHTLDADVGALYGPEWVEPLGRPPVSAFVADGSPVVVRCGGRPVPGP